MMGGQATLWWKVEGLEGDPFLISNTDCFQSLQKGGAKAARTERSSRVAVLPYLLLATKQASDWKPCGCQSVPPCRVCVCV